MQLSTEEFEKLERLVAERDPAASETLRRAYQGLIPPFVTTKPTNARLASDITNAIFETAWEKCDRYPYRDFTFHVWLLRLTDRELEANGIDPHQPTWLDSVL